MAFSYEVKTISADSVSWTALTSPLDCNYVSWRNLGTVQIKVRTDSADPATEETLDPGMQDIITPAAGLPATANRNRFYIGDTVVFFQTTSGTHSIRAKFVR